jgi:hypothetical protein
LVEHERSEGERARDAERQPDARGERLPTVERTDVMAF